VLGSISRSMAEKVNSGRSFLPPEFVVASPCLTESPVGLFLLESQRANPIHQPLNRRNARNKDDNCTDDPSGQIYPACVDIESVMPATRIEVTSAGRPCDGLPACADDYTSPACGDDYISRAGLALFEGGIDPVVGHRFRLIVLVHARCRPLAPGRVRRGRFCRGRCAN
jgi:hypothetical protein